MLLSVFMLLRITLAMFQGATIPAAIQAPTIWHGGVVAHHSLVSDQIEHFWQEASVRYQPDQIILIGPDHKNIGQKVVSIDQALTARRLNLSFAGVDDTLAHENSIQLQQPYLQKWFPHTPVVLLMVRSDASQEQMVALAESLITVFSDTPNVLVVASVDFSHYLSPAEAAIKDAETLKTLQEYNYDVLETYNPDHVDSDQALLVVSEAVCPTHNCPWEVFYYGNADDYIPTTNTTSYYSLLLK